MFINSALTNIGIKVNTPDSKDFDNFSSEEKEKYFEENYYSNHNLFEENKDKFRKFKAIFIDEIQDYKRDWMDIIKTYFLEENGEYVLFGDVKQNIYNNKVDNKDINTNVRSVIELKNSFRSDYRLKDLALDFQNNFFKNKYEIDNRDEFHDSLTLDLYTKKRGDIKYFFLPTNRNSPNNDIIVKLYDFVRQNSIDSSMQPNDITVLGNNISLLKKFDTYYRYSSNEKTNTMFETLEMVYRQGINLAINEPMCKWINDLRKLINRHNDKNSERGNNQISILLVLQDLCTHYPRIFDIKMQYICESFNTTDSDIHRFFERNKLEIDYFKSIYNEKSLAKNIKNIRDNKKINFFMNSGTIKISTVHSFKGWECENVFLIIDKTNLLGFEELLYTGITRGKSNLFIINCGNDEYDIKLKDLIKRFI